VQEKQSMTLTDLSQEQVKLLRCYLNQASHSKYEFNDSLADQITDQWTSLLASSPQARTLWGPMDLMRLLELCRVMTKSLGIESLDMGVWESVLELENARKERVASLPVSVPSSKPGPSSSQIAQSPETLLR
jgi:hypothetical protein